MGRKNNSNANSSYETSGTRQNDESGMRSLTRHREYYLSDGTLYIMIGTTMFRIHAYFFEREAKNFYTKLLDPTSPGEVKKGMSESTAIIVDDCTVRELNCFYGRYNIYHAATEDFFSILRLAAIWDFPEIRAFALREVQRREDEIPLVERIVLYHNYKAPQEYLVPLYAQLCSRPQAPTDEETKQIGENIGWGEVVRVFRARETVRTDSWSPTDSGTPLSPLPKGKNERDTYSTISRPLDLDVDRIDLHTQKNANGRTNDREKARAEKEREKAEREKEKAEKEGKKDGSKSHLDPSTGLYSPLS
ncbi:hypothetical protein BKA70DRAFT_1237061 [Coprinopsis sp. MPI-PUGE-AT-0042]|nr:hypothetical protein BKA70DRAFT_1237061 [Coprinopsis sp. MPI-PUGE-AT-0042]